MFEMLPKIVESNRVIISTGNVLGINKKTGQKVTEELIQCLNLTLTEPKFDKETNQINRTCDDLQSKITEHERNNVKIGAKIFLNQNSMEYLNEAVESVLRILNVDCLDNLILAYHPIDTNSDTTNSSSDSSNGEIEHNDRKMIFSDLKNLWSALEAYSKNKKIHNLGISDLDTEMLTELYNNCTIRPTITQINLSTCCVVPPSLQAFCNTHDIQLLTHSDPEIILENNALEQWQIAYFKPTWVVRYQVHVKCRGVLAAKGYIVGARK